MDYRKRAVFGENWSASRYQVLPYFDVEKKILTQSGVERILDLGCANGWNMSRFSQYGRSSYGLDMVPERVALARTHGPVLIASGLEVPFADKTFDVVYIQHVLHHIGNVEQALKEVWRILKPGGILFLIETVEDSPIIHWGRRLYPTWMGDEINASFFFEGLQDLVTQNGFRIDRAQQYSVLFWLWEIFPDQLSTLEKLTPIFVGIERQLLSYLERYSAHCFLVATKI
jgi:SAM-dependent methyltransferase